MSENIAVHIEILNKTWTFKGLDAICDLVRWLDDHASDETCVGVYQDTPPDAPTPTTSRES